MTQISPEQACGICMCLIVIVQQICMTCTSYKDYKEQKRKNESIKAKIAKLHIDLTPATNAKH